MRSTHSSTAIEGNPLTIEQVRALEEGKELPAVAERSKREVLNYFAGLRFIEKNVKKNPAHAQGEDLTGWLAYTAEELRLTLEKVWTRVQRLAAQSGTEKLVLRPRQEQLLQYVPELTWILFLRILDERETREAEEAEAVNAEFTPSLETPYRWQDWAAPPDVGLEARSTGRHGCLPNVGWKRAELQNGALGAFFGFVNSELIPHLKRLREQPNAVPVSEF